VVLSRSLLCRHGELDVFANDAARLVVCEIEALPTVPHHAWLARGTNCQNAGRL
jgi:hypothetical protein